VSTRPIVAAAVAISILFSTSLRSRGSGAIPGSGGIPQNVARQAPACATCHSPTPSLTPPDVQLVPSARSISLGQSIQVTTSATGGAPGTAGGFVTEATAGTLTAGTNSRISSNGQFITHTSPRNNNRTWTYGYTAPNTPGRVELYTVVNTVNGNFNNSGDVWGFHGADPQGPLNTPVRLFVNAAGTAGFGQGCAGSFGNHAVLGATRSPTVGNSSFGHEIVGAPLGANGVVLYGIRLANPIDLGAIGAPGCLLLVNSIASLGFTTSSGTNPKRGEGTASVPFPIPSSASLRGVTVDTQAVIVDPQNGRPIPVTLTNGLAVIIQ
jgi:hypothetical protein